MSSIFHHLWFSIVRGRLCYTNVSRILVETIGKVERPDKRPKNMPVGTDLDMYTCPVEQNFEIVPWEKIFFFRKLGNLIPIIVTIDHFPVAPFVFEIMIWVRSTSLRVGYFSNGLTSWHCTEHVTWPSGCRPRFSRGRPRFYSPTRRRIFGNAFSASCINVVVRQNVKWCMKTLL